MADMNVINAVLPLVSVLIGSAITYVLNVEDSTTVEGRGGISRRDRSRCRSCREP